MSADRIQQIRASIPESGAGAEVRDRLIDEFLALIEEDGGSVPGLAVLANACVMLAAQADPDSLTVTGAPGARLCRALDMCAAALQGEGSELDTVFEQARQVVEGTAPVDAPANDTSDSGARDQNASSGVRSDLHEHLTEIVSTLMLLGESDADDVSHICSQVKDLLEVHGDSCLSTAGEALQAFGACDDADEREDYLQTAALAMGDLLERLDDEALGAHASSSPIESESPGPSEAPADEQSGDGAPPPVADAASPDQAQSPGETPAKEDVPASDHGFRDGMQADLPAGAGNDMLADFIAEAAEYLEQAEEGLLALESDPSDNEAVNEIFRAFHTIKGVAGFLELTWVSEFAHHTESLLSQVRDGVIAYVGVVPELTLRATDIMKALVAEIRQALTGQPMTLPNGYSALHAVLADSTLHDRLAKGEDVELPERPHTEDDNPGAGPARNPTGAGAEGSVRVKTDRLDRLVDLVGELVIAQSIISTHPVFEEGESDLSRRFAESSKILRELQDLSTGLRMVPLKPAFRKASRVIRDLSKKMGKQVRLITEGEDTEIDRTMVDVIADPLVHMVRNSLDHGLEPTDERVEAGKPAEGTIRLSAYQEGGSVVICIADDGRGLDRDKIKNRAVERGILDPGRTLSDSEIYGLVFQPGFSTAEVVTDVSGRGVGMDVVRRNVESLRGRITIESDRGSGSRFYIHLPLTLAITDGMLVRVGRSVYIIPTVKIHMSFRPPELAITTMAGRGEMIRILNELLPVVRLADVYGVEGAVTEAKDALMVIVGEGTRKTALMVDELVAQQQFVIKPLSEVAAKAPGVVGGAILGDGSVGLIVDPDELIRLLRSGTSHAVGVA